MFCDCWPYEVQTAHHPNRKKVESATGVEAPAGRGIGRRDPAGIRVPARPFLGHSLARQTASLPYAATGRPMPLRTR